MTSTTATSKKSKGFSEFEREAIKERAQEILASKGSGEAALQAKIAQMKGSDRAMAQRIHAIIGKNAPSLSPKTWYGMPAYANKDDKVVCFFQAGEKYKVRYATLGFSDAAHLDEGSMWPTTFALKELTKVQEEKIIALLKQAVS